MDGDIDNEYRRQLDSIRSGGYTGELNFKGFSIINRVTNEITQLNDLSDGEKIFLSMVAEILKLSNFVLKSFSSPVILIDEPDSKLHPANAVKLLNALVKNFPNAILIIFTHSASTVALADEFCIINMHEGMPQKVEQDFAIRQLLVGVSPLMIRSNKSIDVFVEGASDFSVFNYVYEIIKNKVELMRQPRFIKVSENDSQGGKDIVKAVVKNIYSVRDSVYGVVDYDNKEVETGDIKVFGLNEFYGLENILFDPLVILIVLHVNNTHELDKFMETRIDINKLLNDTKLLQNTVNNLLIKAGIVSNSDIRATNPKLWSYSGGVNLSLPSILFSTECHEIEARWMKLPLLGFAINKSKRFEKLTSAMRIYEDVIPCYYISFFEKLCNI